MNGYRCKLKRDFCEELMNLIDRLLLVEVTDRYYKLLWCLLSEIKSKLYKRLYELRNHYTFTFSAGQAWALVCLYNEFIKDPTTYAGNVLHGISVEVQKQFAC